MLPRVARLEMNKNSSLFCAYPTSGVWIKESLDKVSRNCVSDLLKVSIALAVFSISALLSTASKSEAKAGARDINDAKVF